MNSIANKTGVALSAPIDQAPASLVSAGQAAPARADAPDAADLVSPSSLTLSLHAGDYHLGAASLQVPAGGSQASLRSIEVVRQPALTAVKQAPAFTSLLAATYLSAQTQLPGVAALLPAGAAMWQANKGYPTMLLAAALGCMLQSSGLPALLAYPLGVQLGVLLTTPLTAKPANEADGLENAHALVLSQPVQAKLAHNLAKQVQINQLWRTDAGVLGLDAQLTTPLPFTLPLTQLVDTAQHSAVASLGAYGEALAAAQKLAELLDSKKLLALAFPGPSAEDPAAAAALETHVRAAFNLLLDRTHMGSQKGVASTAALHPGTHKIEGLGLDASLQAAKLLLLQVQPNTVATLSTGAIDQRAPSPRAPQAAWFVRLGCAVGHFFAAAWRALKALLRLSGAPLATRPVAEVVSPLTPTDPAARLYTHGIQVRLNRRVSLSLGNWSRFVLSASLVGADVDDHGAITPRGSLRLLGVPIFSLNSPWLRNHMEAAGLNLTTDPHRLLWGGQLFAADAAAPKPLAAPTTETWVGAQARQALALFEQQRERVSQSERGAAAQAVLGSVLGRMELQLIPHATLAPRLQLAGAVPQAAPGTVQVLRSHKPFSVRFDLHQFQQKQEIILSGLELEAQVRSAQTAANVALPRAVLNVGKVQVNSFWLDPLEASVVTDVAASDVQLGFRGADAAQAQSFVSLRQALWSKNAVREQLRVDMQATGKLTVPMEGVLQQMGGLWANPAVQEGIKLFAGLHFDETNATPAPDFAFVPGSPRPRLASPAASQAGSDDGLDGETLVASQQGSGAPSQASSRRSSYSSAKSEASSATAVNAPLNAKL